MKKIEIIWRELLYQALEKKNRSFTQKEIAAKFGFSTSTVFQALKIPRKMGAVRVTGRFFILEDCEKLLYHWASVRSIEKDIIFTGNVKLAVLDIESRMPPEVVFGGFTAAREILGGVAPADYDTVYIYATGLEEIKKRFELGKDLPALQARQGRANLTILKADKFLASYGQITTLGQTFVDIWNLPIWYAKEFTKSLKEKIDELLP
ncbi:hypothetical protein A3D81_00165 [Candidatus Curtissbacteria bacterium RIFCSPHIGHO2_02_FULL_40_17]|uniref:Helix-turn-helix type 11 domain-containing protein n=2 Tax=Candidatus Curtissiibacteriota TaxID=1752717 RepID=A0A1F5GHB8_9BACT|nr:MAG: hypothetical protein A2693_00025 [Candidatus Curtissbacteria bacterium RIFCSPHIGHO2_01_FULL_40_12]OGD91245.1 MAG: hypothetical protein A3D81_00165 [Candidatus Curtissbacteria bacterium RIFCSPHIGHO2_02_FULL_40_17]